MPEDAGEDAETEDAQQVQVDPDEPDLPDESEAGDAQVGADASTEPLDAHADSALVDSWVGPDVQSGCSIFNGDCFDVGPPVVDGTVPIQPDVQPLVCHSHAECGAEQFCLAEACQPRCNADGACIVHQVPAGKTVAQFASDDQALYFSYYGDVAAGSSGELWRREPGQTATLVTDQIGSWGDFVVRDGYAYFRRGARFFRAKVAPQSPAEELYVVPGAQDVPWTLGDGFLVVSVHDGFWFGSPDGKQALRKIDSELVGAPPAVHASGDRFYFPAKTRVNDSELMRVKSVRMVEPYAIEDASPVLQGQNFDGSIVEVRPPYAYFGWRSPQRVNLQTGEIETLSGVSAPGHSLDTRFRISGDWVYSYNPGYENPAGSSIDRYFLGKPSIAQQIQPPRPGGQSAAGMIMEAVGKRFYSSNGSLIYEKALPPAPCESQAQCEADEICGPSAVCLPRCYEDGSCLVFQGTRQVIGIHTDGSAPYVVLDTTRDALDNSKLDAELWQVVPQGASRLVSNRIGDPYSVVLRAGYAYYRRGKDLHRVSLQPGSTEQLLYALPANDQYVSWAVDETFIAMSTSAGIAFGSPDGQAPLRSIVGPPPANVGRWLRAHQDRIYFGERNPYLRLRSIRMVEPYAIEDVVEAVQAHLDGGARKLDLDTVRGDFFYYVSSEGGMQRVDRTDGTKYAVSAPVPLEPWSSCDVPATELIGDWVYTSQECSEGAKPTKEYLRRCSILSLGTCQEVASLRSSVATGIGPLVGVAGDKLYASPTHDHSREGLLYELPLPPPPCNAQLPCATGTSCGTDNLCH